MSNAKRKRLFRYRLSPETSGYTLVRGEGGLAFEILCGLCQGSRVMLENRGKAQLSLEYFPVAFFALLYTSLGTIFIYWATNVISVTSEMVVVDLSDIQVYISFYLTVFV
jgi:hypothetical protein